MAGVGELLLQKSALTLFHRRDIFQSTLAQLITEGYRGHLIDADDRAVFYAQMSRALRFYEQFGYQHWTGNLDALNDAYRALEARAVVHAFTRFDVLHKSEPDFAEALLQVIADASQDHLRDGIRLIALVQTDDANFESQLSHVVWNERELRPEARGL